MRVGYIGNFEPEHSTENHVLRALHNTGHEVTTFQENQFGRWDDVANEVGDFDFVLWTRTGWDPPVPADKQAFLSERSAGAGVPLVGYHLDRWWGLNREYQLRDDPFFKIDLVVTADGDPSHQEKFAALGINHMWMPPGVSRDECARTPNVVPGLMHDIVFCGSSQSYHNEWSYRLQLVQWLESTFGDRLGLYPRDKPALRGQELFDLYNNSKVMVGDSCLNGGIRNYWSDRIPETLGRGGFLIHPWVEGIDDHFTDGKHLVTYPLGDFGRLHELIEYFVASDAMRRDIAAAGRAHVLEHHTYERRMEQLVEALKARGMVR